MADPVRLPGPVTLERIRRQGERRMSPEEFQAGMDAPVSDEERQEVLKLLRWFRRRYPTPGERLASTRRALRQWDGGRRAS